MTEHESQRQPRPHKKLKRILLRMALGFVALVVLLIILLYLPPVQRYLTNQLEKSLSRLLQSEVGIGSLGIAFPKAVALNDCYLITPDGDSLILFEELDIDVNMWQLFNKTVSLQGVRIRGLQTELFTTADTSNYQYVIDAVTTGDTSATQKPGWQVQFQGISLRIEDSEIYFLDETAGFFVDASIGDLVFRGRTIDPGNSMFDFSRLAIEDSGIISVIQPSEPATGGATALTISGRSTRITKTLIDFTYDTIGVYQDITNFEINRLQLTASEDFSLSARTLIAEYPAFRLDIGAPAQETGFDPAHLDFRPLAVQAEDLNIANDTIILQLNSARFVQAGGPNVEHLAGKISYAPGDIRVEDGEIQSDTTNVTLPAANFSYTTYRDGHIKTMDYEAIGEGILATNDVLWAMPRLRENQEYKQLQGQTITFEIDAGGNQAQLDFRKLKIDAPGLKIDATGNARQLLQPEQFSLVVRQGTIRAEGSMLEPLIPTSWIPPHIDLPESLFVEGAGKYSPRALSFDLNVTEQRQETSVISIRGGVNGFDSLQTARVNAIIDTLSISGASVLAYLPDTLIPEGYHLPERMKAKGNITGLASDLRIDLFTSINGDSTFANVNGSIENLTRTEDLNLNLSVAEMMIHKADVLSSVPASIFPDTEVIPSFAVLNDGKVRGTIDNFTIHLPLSSPAGNVLIDGTYQPEDLSFIVEGNNASLSPWISGQLLDSLPSWQLDTLGFHAAISGSLHPQRNLVYEISLLDAVQDSFATSSGTIDAQRIASELTISHDLLQTEGTTRISNYDNENLEIDADLSITAFDLRKTGITDEVRSLEGEVEFTVQGTGIDEFSLDGRLDDLILSDGMPVAWIDSVLIDGNTQGRQVSLHVTSDVLEGHLEGQFEPSEISAELRNLFDQYFSERKSPSVSGNSFSASLDIYRTGPLTSGLIPGLTELEPFSVQFVYRRGDTLVDARSSIKHLVYNETAVDNLDVVFNGKQNSLEYRITLKDLAYLGNFALGQTEISGQSSGSGLDVQAEVFNESGIERHVLAGNVERQGDTLSVRLDPDQLIHFQPWQLPPANALKYARGYLKVTSWELASGSERIELHSPDSQSLRVEFDQFDINNLAQLLNTEQDIASGRVVGTITLSHLFDQAVVKSDMTIYDLRVLRSIFGTLTARISTEDQRDFNIDMGLRGFGNQLTLDGIYNPDGSTELVLDVQSLRLKTLESFAQGYLDNTAGFLEGVVNFTGTVDKPRMDGRLQFRKATVEIPQFGSTYAISNNPVTFSGPKISLQDLRLTDSENNAATVNGTVTVHNIDRIALDLSASARNFLALNSTAEDNDLYYGRLVVDADIRATGTVRLPVIRVDAAPRPTSSVTYVYAEGDGAIETSQGVVRFAEDYEWDEILEERIKDDTSRTSPGGLDLILNLDVNENMTVTVLLDALTDEKFTGAASGNLTYQEYPNGVQEMTGRLELTRGTYDFVYRGILRRQFELVAGSNIQFTGDLYNPLMDLEVRYPIEASPYPLVTTIDPQADPTGLRRNQLFYVVLEMDGNLNGTELRNDIIYPDDVPGNQSIGSVNEALSVLRSDESRLRTTAFSLLAFKSFNFPVGGPSGFDPGVIQESAINAALDAAFSQALSNTIGFVDIDLDVDYTTENGRAQFDSRISVNRTFFNDRLIISIDGIVSTERDDNGTEQSYIDNITAEYLLTERGNLRLRIFNDRDRNALVGDNVVRFGGRLVFSKDFEKLRWFGKD